MYNINSFINRFVVVFFVSFLSFISYSSFAENSPSHSRAHVVDSASVNINTADAQAITGAHIKGIGKKRAQAIVAYRTQHGPFKSVDELKNIKGLSEKIIVENKDRLKLD